MRTTRRPSRVRSARTCARRASRGAGCGRPRARIAPRSCRNCLRREKSPRRSSSATPLSRLARCRCSFGPGRDAVDRPSVVLSSSATTDVSTRPFPGSASHTHTARASTRRGRSFASSRPPPRTAPVARVDTRSRRARSVVPGPGYSRGALLRFSSRRSIDGRRCAPRVTLAATTAGSPPLARGRISPDASDGVPRSPPAPTTSRGGARGRLGDAPRPPELTRARP